MFGKHVCVPIADCLQQPRRPFDVGEEERHRAGRKLGQHTPIHSRPGAKVNPDRCQRSSRPRSRGLRDPAETRHITTATGWRRRESNPRRSPLDEPRSHLRSRVTTSDDRGPALISRQEDHGADTASLRSVDGPPGDSLAAGCERRDSCDGDHDLNETPVHFTAGGARGLSNVPWVKVGRAFRAYLFFYAAELADGRVTGPPEPSSDTGGGTSVFSTKILWVVTAPERECDRHRSATRRDWPVHAASQPRRQRHSLDHPHPRRGLLEVECSQRAVARKRGGSGDRPAAAFSCD